MEMTQDALREHRGRVETIGHAVREKGREGQSSAPAPLHQEPLQGAWETMERIPAGAYYFAMLGSIAAALGLYVSGKKESAQFVGQWAPTIALLGLMNKLLRPARER
jgi:phosphotransferase system  glucose/maltose/N-acetylglucosamine-specific IIC component